MRLLRLDLRAYGPFIGKSLSFDGAGLHLIFGGNEAGKSTALRALQAVLYGMKEKGDAHRTTWEMMRVGLSIETSDGKVLNVERRKGTGVKSLVYAASDRSVPAEEWARVLPVADAKVFEQMFGINYERLVEGGRKLAEGEGDIGQALLAAAGDLGEAVERMRGFETRAGELFGEHAHSRALLNQTLRHYRDAEARIKSEKFTSNAYKTAVKEQVARENERDKLTDELRHCAAEIRRLSRLEQAAGPVSQLLDCERELAGMESVRTLGQDFAGRYQEADLALRSAASSDSHCRAEIERLHTSLDGIRCEPLLLELADEIERLRTDPHGVRAAREQLPRRAGEVRQLRKEVREKLVLLDLDRDPADCASLRVKPAVRSRIAKLSTDHARLTTGLDTARQTVNGLKSLAHGNELELAALPAAVDTADLERCLSHVPRNLSLEVQLAELERNRAGLEARLAADLKALPLWAGSAEKLEEAPVPLMATVNEFAERYTKRTAHEEQIAKKHALLVGEIANQRQEIRVLEQSHEVPTKETLAQDRARRDLGWEAVKDRWLDENPNGMAEGRFLQGANDRQPLESAYEDAVYEADQVADRLRFEADRVQKKALTLDRIVELNAKLGETRIDSERASGEHTLIDGEWFEIWAAAGIVPRTPREMVGWLETRGRIVDQLRSLGTLREQARQVAGSIELLKTSLADALELIGIASPGTLVDLVAISDRVFREANEIRTKRRDLEVERKRLQGETRTAAEQARNSEEALDTWRVDWAQAINGLSVRAGAMPDEVREVIELLDQIAAGSKDICDLEYRIRTMEGDEKEHAAAVGEIIDRLSRTELRGSDPLIAISKLQEGAIQARRSDDMARRAADDLVRNRDLQAGMLRDIAKHTEELTALCKEAGLDGRDQLPEAIQAADRKRNLGLQINGHRKALLPSCGGGTLAELIEEVQGLDWDGLPGAKREFEERQTRLDNQKLECARRIDELERDFQIHETAAAFTDAAVAKQAAAARIDGLAGEYLERQLGTMLLKRAIDLYRTKHQDPLLQRAGEYFKALTCGAFARLAIDYDDGGQRIMRGVRANSEKHVDMKGMSDGTRDQLFFALRLAYIEGHCEQFGPCPVILDDVLMAFDDSRATAALGALAELSKKTQILIFTHHAHHVELAERALEKHTLKLHELETGAVAAV